jgi:hypothetical protein
MPLDKIPYTPLDGVVIFLVRYHNIVLNDSKVIGNGIYAMQKIDEWFRKSRVKQW